MVDQNGRFFVQNGRIQNVVYIRKWKVGGHKSKLIMQKSFFFLFIVRNIIEKGRCLIKMADFFPKIDEFEPETEFSAIFKTITNVSQSQKT